MGHDVRDKIIADESFLVVSRDEIDHWDTVKESVELLVAEARVVADYWRPEITNSGLPGVLLVHGGAAHRKWWTPIAGRLSSQVPVAALDLSGHGDSDWRQDYSAETWAIEIDTFSGWLGDTFKRPVVVVAHSLGGLASLVACSRPTGNFAHAVIIDAPVRPRDNDASLRKARNVFTARRGAPSSQALIDRFRLVPSQPARECNLFDHVRENSVRRVGAVWEWKYDPKLFQFSSGPHPSHWYIRHLELGAPRCSLISCAESSIVTDSIWDFMVDRFEVGDPSSSNHPTRLPGKHHHLMFDSVSDLVEVLTNQLEFVSG